MCKGKGRSARPEEWSSPLPIALDHEPREGPQTIGRITELIHCRQSFGELPVGLAAALLDPQQARIGVLALVGVFTRALAELLGRGGDVEQVVHDLERQADVPAEAS